MDAKVTGELEFDRYLCCLALHDVHLPPQPESYDDLVPLIDILVSKSDSCLFNWVNLQFLIVVGCCVWSASSHHKRHIAFESRNCRLVNGLSALVAFFYWL